MSEKMHSKIGKIAGPGNYLEYYVKVPTKGLDPLDVLDELTRKFDWSDRRHSAEGYIIYRLIEEKIGDEWYYGDIYVMPYGKRHVIAIMSKRLP